MYLAQSRVVVGVTAVDITTPTLTNYEKRDGYRMHVKVLDGEAQGIFIGKADVTVANGYPIGVGEEREFDIHTNDDLWAVAAADTDVALLLENL